MGDTGSLSLGATLATVAILTSHEFSLAVIGGVFVIETLSVIIQIFSVVVFKKKVFLMYQSLILPIILILFTKVLL